MLESYKNLSSLVQNLDTYLKTKHPQFFGENANHPVSYLKPFKVIHDPIWGTNRFSWRELALLDSPVLQRIRVIRQTGLAHYVYPSAQHSRLEHSLWVVTISSRIFNALAQRQFDQLKTIIAAVKNTSIDRLRQELRLAALLHDIGHSLFSHVSERVYSKLSVVQHAATELSSFVGKEKGAGEVLSFCLSQTDAIAGLLRRADEKVRKNEFSGEYYGEIDLENVSLMIVGRSKHPFLQFMGDIISSGFDADKLDYLLRDAVTAGLPLRYDLDRYLHTVYLEKDVLADGEGKLEKLYSSIGTNPDRKEAIPEITEYPFYDTYRLRLPKQAMSTIEQIVICKLMLYSYIYHHQKVRAAEGLMVKLLDRLVEEWRSNGKSDQAILEEFISADDSALQGTFFAASSNIQIRDYSYRLVNRLLPRWVYGFNAAVSHAEGALIRDFFSSLQDKAKRTTLIKTLEEAIGEELVKQNPGLGANAKEALWNAGVWLDVPNVPKFEDMRVLIGRTTATYGHPIKDIFPIGQWTEAYEAHQFHVRIYSFSEFSTDAEAASRKAVEKVIKITTKEFFDTFLNPRLTVSTQD